MRFGRIRRIHLVGIGGTGMRGIARILLELGYEVSGSDLHEGSAVAELRAAGARIAIGHRPENLGEAQVVVVSTAIPADNPELRAAQDRLVPVIHRAEMLAELMRLKQGIAVAGAHGKTTTTSLVSHLLEVGGLDPTAIIGGRLKEFADHGKLGQGEWLVAEADESDGSFLRLSPVIAVINNVDEEHLDYWGSFARLCDGFVEFANRVPFYGLVVLGQDDPRLAELRPRIRRPVLTFGAERPADLEGRLEAVDAEGMRFRLRWQGEAWYEGRLPLVGVHNLRNALAAAAVAREVGLGVERILEGLASFPGIERRFEILRREPVVVVDDYGHHPAEIAATIQAARERWPERPLWVVFQPHRYSRTQRLWGAFRRVLPAADVVRLTDLYPAGETPVPGIDAERLAREVHEIGHPDVAHVAKEELVERLVEEVPPGAVVLFLGAGDVTNRARAYAAALA